MRLASILLVLVLSACAGTYGGPSTTGQTAEMPPTASGGDYARDGFYDGGVFDPDLTQRPLRQME